MTPFGSSPTGEKKGEDAEEVNSPPRRPYRNEAQNGLDGLAFQQIAMREREDNVGDRADDRAHGADPQ
jgi:hypothetical protein